ncbi:MAG: NAD(P)H-dependent oxidoreductase subunit E [Phycisphaerales bacterium]|nr:NAD(P)H-dependent oxidoreductase subunit E [Phycisphaerales bacterium]
MAWIAQNRQQPLAPGSAGGSSRGQSLAPSGEPPAEPGANITEAIRKEIIEKYFPRYPSKRAALLPLFHLVMHEYGYIAPEVIGEAAKLLEMTHAEVLDAATFYEEFRFELSGKYVVNVCRSIACELRGHDKILAKIKEIFGIDPAETTDDGLISLYEIECLGLCEQAPAALINGQPHGNLTPESFCETLKKLTTE